MKWNNASYELNFHLIVLGTIPLATDQVQNNAPYADIQQPSAPQVIQDPSLDPSLAPTQPVSPASPPGGGWNLYPSIRELNLSIESIKFELINNNQFIFTCSRTDIH